MSAPSFERLTRNDLLRVRLLRRLILSPWFVSAYALYAAVSLLRFMRAAFRKSFSELLPSVQLSSTVSWACLLRKAHRNRSAWNSPYSAANWRPAEVWRSPRRIVETIFGLNKDYNFMGKAIKYRTKFRDWLYLESKHKKFGCADCAPKNGRSRLGSICDDAA